MNGELELDVAAAASAYLTCLVSDGPLQLGARAVWASLTGIPDDDQDALVAAAEEAEAAGTVAHVSPF